MDGNGRWAQGRGLKRVAGHKRGVLSVRSTVEKAVEIGLKALTLYCFSTENWKRDPAEVEFLMNTFLVTLFEERPRILKNNIRFRLIGDRSKLSEELVEAAENLERETSTNTGLWLVLAINYGGRDEIIRAFKSLSLEGAKPDDIDEKMISDHLYTRGLPDPDMVIRTSGEMRLSNFLIWQSAYSELVFFRKFWPDFSGNDLMKAIRIFQNRNRRFGG
jgi:undecaprenyl diphosphate synthase